jgi:hypothetical protein
MNTQPRATERELVDLAARAEASPTYREFGVRVTALDDQHAQLTVPRESVRL